MTRLLWLFSFFLLAPACTLRSTLAPQKGELRAVLWHGATVEATGGAQLRLPARTVVKVAEAHNGSCRVSANGEVAFEGTAPCSRLGMVVVRPADVHLRPDGPMLFRLNGGVLVAPRERRGDWIRIAGEVFSSEFTGWIRAADVGGRTERSWLAPGLPRFPWVCEEGGWIHDKPGGTFLTWIPDPWCRVKLLGEEEKGWSRIEYLDGRVRLVGWIESGALRPDRHPRFHPGARSMRVKTRAPVFGTAAGDKAFGTLEPGTRIWGSIQVGRRTLVQTQGAPVEVVGWVDSAAIE
jgi:hypothetical protein